MAIFGDPFGPRRQDSWYVDMLHFNDVSKAFNGTKVLTSGADARPSLSGDKTGNSSSPQGPQFQFNRDKTVYVNHYHFYIDDEDFGPLFLKVCSYAPWGNQAVHQ